MPKKPLFRSRTLAAMAVWSSMSAAAAEPPPAPAPDDTETLRRLQERAYAESDPDRRGQLLLTLHQAAFELGAATCQGAPSRDRCARVVETRLNLYRTAKVLELRTRRAAEPPARPLACADAGDVPTCLQRTFESDWLGSNAALAPNRVAFVSATERGDDRVAFVVGEVVTDPDGHATAVVVLSDETVVDPLLAGMDPGAHTTVGPREPLGASGYVVIPGSSTLRISRPLRADEPIMAVCDQRIVRVKRAPLAGIGVAEVEWGDGGVFPEYAYRLPCDARVVLAGDVATLRAGPSVPWPLAAKEGESRTTSAADVTIVEAPNGACAMSTEGASWSIDRSACELHFAGDLNGDGRLDAVFDVRGEMGCGGLQLLLSNPTGWTVAAGTGGYC